MSATMFMHIHYDLIILIIVSCILLLQSIYN